MKGGASLEETTEAKEQHDCVEAETEKGSPSLEATEPKPEERSDTNGRQLVTPKGARKNKKQKDPPQTQPKKNKPKTTKPNKMSKQKAPKGSPSNVEFPDLKFPGTGKLPRLIYGNSIVYFSPGRYRVMRNKTDIVDKAFSYRVDSPKVAWKKVCAELRRVNPRE